MKLLLHFGQLRVILFLMLFFTTLYTYGQTTGSKANTDSVDTFDIRTKSFLLPQPLPKGKYYQALALQYIVVPKDWTTETVTAPMFAYTGKYTLPAGFNLQGGLSTLIISYRFTLGPFWNYTVDHFNFGAGYQVAFNYGVLNHFGFTTHLTIWEQQPSLTVGYSFKEMAVILRGDMYLTSSLKENQAGYTVSYPSFTNGYSISGTIEQRLWKNHLMSFGVKMNYLKYHILAWPAFPVNQYRYWVPEFDLGLVFNMMNMKYRLIYLLLVSITFFSCSKNGITLPPDNPNTNLIGTTPISNTIMKSMEGIYSLSDGSSKLGSEFVCKISKYKVSFFSNESGIFFILGYGLKQSDGSIQFSGFWRYSENATQGTISFAVSAADGASDLLNGIVSNLQLKGNFNPSNQSISLKYKRPFSQYVLTHEFSIFAHHGVQTTANPPYAQNSIDGVLNDEDYGVNGLEYDIRLTKDNVPILMHDANYDIRLTQKGPVYGDFNLYTFDFLEKYVRLVDGQKIPSLEHVLRVFIDSTTMKYMWMDIKGDPDVFKYLEPIVRNAYAHAAAVNRDVVLIADLPSEAVIAEYQKQPSYGANLPCMCELSMQDVIDNNCKYFGPRFTLGLLLDDVNKGHSLGIKTYSWTINDKLTLSKYLTDGKFDGFDTDYPAYVVYDYYAHY